MGFIDTRGYFNSTHNQLWAQKVLVKPCEKCKLKDFDDCTLEMFLRFNIHHKLQSETGHFDRIFRKYRGITINLTYHCIEEKDLLAFTCENEVVEYFLKKRLTLGVGFYWPEGVPSYKCTRTHLSIPILKHGKMWQILMYKILVLKDYYTPVDEKLWNDFTPEPIYCLFCNDYPRDLYPGNFVVNQNILYLKTIIWVDKRKLHKKRGEKVIMYSEQNNIIDWPFLSKHSTVTRGAKTINILGNMSFFTPGKVFVSFIDIIISKLIKVNIQNSIIYKLSHYYKKSLGKRTLSSLNISISELIQMHKICKRKKKYEIIDTEGKRVYYLKEKNLLLYNTDFEENNEGERILIEEIFAKNNYDLLNDERHSQAIIKWFHFPKTRIKEQNTVSDYSRMIKRGEIDIAISQTSILNKDYATLKSSEVDNDNNNKEWRYYYYSDEFGAANNKNEPVYPLMGTTYNLDVYRVGRFTRNAPTNSYSNICGIAFALQKVLTKDSKTKEPKYITSSEVGFIDLITTADTPKNSGLVLEGVLDTVVSSRSTTASTDSEMRTILQKLYPDCREVANPNEIESLIDDNNKGFQYVCANQRLYKFQKRIPNNLSASQISYITQNFGLYNHFRFAQYALKIEIPFIELIEQTRGLFWECTSYDGNIYKLHVDGLFYSPTEFINFYHKKKGNSLLWVGYDGEKIPNIFGPSIRITPHPNKCHLARVGHAAFSSKNFVGTATNSLSIGQLHQKTLTVAFNQSKSHPTEIINIPGCYPKILVASGFNNQEDGIAIRKGAIERGMFSATFYETAVVKINYKDYSETTAALNNNISPIEFHPTIQKGSVLKMGLLIGVFRLNKKFIRKNIQLKYSIDLFSTEFKIKEITEEGGDIEYAYYDDDTTISSRDKNGNVTISSTHINNNNWNMGVFWIGKGCMVDGENPTYDYFYNNNLTHKQRAKQRMSLAFQSQNQNYQRVRCEMIRCDNVESCQYLKMYLTYASLFTPSIGDKLQTTTSNKGVITEIISDENMPYVIVTSEKEKESSRTIIPDMIINPQFLKRQTLDSILMMGEKEMIINSSDKNIKRNYHYMNNCFDFTIQDAIYYLQLGNIYASGRLMNPITGLPYLAPIENQNGIEYKNDDDFSEYFNAEDGFTYMMRRKKYNTDISSSHSSSSSSYKVVNATVYTTRYFLVHNHKATSMMQCSHPDEIIRTEFSGAPIKGKRGGFATGPQEQMTLVGLGAERLNLEISQLRSDVMNIPVFSKKKNDKEKEEEEEDDDDTAIIHGSKTLKRVFDEFNQYDIDFSLKIAKCNEMYKS